MTHLTDEDIEFLLCDELTDADRPSAEEAAMHVDEPELPTDLTMLVAEDLELGAAAGGDGDAAAEEHEEDVEEIVRRLYGLLSEEPDGGPRDEAGPTSLGAGEFVCRACFLRRSVEQLSDATRQTCRDCASNEA